MASGRGLTGFCLALVTASGGFGGNALAQQTANSLVPGIAPYAPKAPPSVAQSARRKGGQAPSGTAADQDASSAAGTPSNQTSGSSAQASTESRAPEVASDAAGPVVPHPASAKQSYDYVLGPGDKLRISVFGEETLTGEFNVAGNGQISYPLIGQVPASGITVRHLQAEIRNALADGYLKDPRVTAEVLTFRPYYILGEVSKPGEYPYTDGISVMNAIATAGGFSYRANQKFIFIKGPNDKVEHRERLSGSLLLAPGDTVRVVERYF